MKDITRTLAAFVAQTQWEDIPPKVRHEAKRALVNYFAVALAGCSDPGISKAVSVYGRFSSGREAGLIGREEKTDILNAAALNAMSANVFDFDDTHLPTIIHPTAPVAAPLFALAEKLPLSGKQWLLAFVLGVEIECRLGNAVSPGHYQRGWHITSTCGVFGAAAAISKALNLDASHIAWAFGNASAQSSGLVETLGSMSKSISVGNAAGNGLLSALLAQEGFAGPERPIEGERGFLRVMSDATDADVDSAFATLGREWALLSNTYKPYPCGVVLNPVIEACLELSAAPGFSFPNVEQVTLSGHPLLRARTDRPNITLGREAQVSAQHSVAVALARGRAGLAEFTDAAVADPLLRAFASRLDFVDDPAYSVEAAQVTIVLRSGETMSRRIDAARGSLQAPLADTDLEDKLRDLAEYGGSSCRASPLIDALWALEIAPDASLPMRLACP
ncbi:MmgE/PrpD family protein [Caballeronia udeis]|uniref:MmgE/PrpD family protein n=1 Tax=Caballeronia udeis TaxID=1232866 RepID=A0A158J1R0_9BURK|nr:MmgE/PrpD family protein [Caballeronia udeis]SAL62309.1 MmgE/PrpD family protein [Caballeronia udeis]